MATKTSPPLDFTTIGAQTATIPVRIGYRIVELFSDGLYSSPNKAIEELVSNSFDAGAKNVHVMLSPDRRSNDAMVVVIDDGNSMDAMGLRQHWVIGESNKRSEDYNPPLGRKQIGKFGIGKLATFVLANHFTHLCKRDGQYYAVTMDYGRVTKTDKGLADQPQISLPLRELTEMQARDCLPDLVTGSKPGHKAFKLFGKGASESWTIAILSKLKPMAAQIKKGQLAWVLRTAMPLRDDFALFLDGDRLKSSKFDVKLIKRWTLGKDLNTLPKPAPQDLETSKDSKNAAVHKYGLMHSSLGRITGYVEVYEESLTGGKSDEIGRSNGFFVYVRDRLVNIDDERFGINPDTLRHGTFTNFRAVLHIDRLDDELRSTREGVREGELTTIARNIAHALFNIARKELADHDDRASPDTKARGKIGNTPGSLTRRPMQALMRLILDGKITSRYVRIPSGADAQTSEFLQGLRSRLESTDGFITAIRHEYIGAEAGISIYDAATGALLINDLHPFVAMYRDDYEKAETLRLLCVAEVLTEAYLHTAGVHAETVDEILSARDELLRHFARSQPRNASITAQMLEDAAHDENQLEQELVAAFTSLGFDAVPIGGKGNPDGVATARLGGSDTGARRYKVSLEAKSKEKDDTKISARTVHISGIARHRDDHACDHAVVVGPDFQGGEDEGGVVVQEARENIKQTGRTITLIRIRDLARLVRLAPLKGVALDRLRELFTTCVTPDESRKWVDRLDQETPKKMQFRKILDTIWTLQSEQPDEPVELAAVKLMLRRDHDVDLPKNELGALCNALARIAPNYVITRGDMVELTQKPDLIVKEAGATLQQFPGDETVRSIFKL